MSSHAINAPLTWSPSPVYDRMISSEWWWSKPRATGVRDAYSAAHGDLPVDIFTDATGRYRLARPRLPGEPGGEPQVSAQAQGNEQAMSEQ